VSGFRAFCSEKGCTREEWFPKGLSSVEDAGWVLLNDSWFCPQCWAGEISPDIARLAGEIK
jgi:hypothetical protein